MRKLLALLLLFPGTAFAVAPELCGSGLDEPGNTMGTANGTFGSCPAGYGYSISGTGCDLLCPGADQDNDGYTSNGQLGTAGSTAIDCDDTNKFVFPGVWTAAGCTGGQIHQCHATNGTYSSCVAQSAITCEATGSGVCYHVNCDSGNDANAGTYAAPFKSLAKVSGGSGGTGMPASPVTLAAGDVVYVRGTLCNTTMTSSSSAGLGTQPVLAEFASNGTLTNKITIKALPGNTPILYTLDGPGVMVTGAHTKFQGLWLITARSSNNNASGIWSIGDYTTVESCGFLGMAGHGDNNDACVHFSHTAGGKVFRSVFKDCDRQAGNVDNIAAVSWLDDNDDPTECFDHEAKWNTVVQTAVDAVGGGQAFKQKHGCKSADVGANKHPIQYNRITGVNRIISWNGSSLRFSGNIAVTNTNTARFFEDGAGNPMQDNEITDNTFVDSTQLEWSDPYYTVTPEKLTILRNVFRDSKASYNGGNNEGIFAFDGYGSAGNKTTFETSPYYLSSNNNCFYNPNATLVWSYFNQGDSSGQFSFANWKLRPVSYDAASFVENPTFNAYYGATSANCTNKGIQFTILNTPSPGVTNNLNVAHRILNVKRKKR